MYTDDKKIAEYVAEDFRTAAVFKKHKIDFCCRGGVSLKEVCQKKKLDYEAIVNDLEQIKHQKAENHIDFKAFPLDLLADYIEKIHHRYVEDKAPILLQFLEKLCRVHGERHPELLEIHEHFRAAVHALENHFVKEEKVLFPFIRDMVIATRYGKPIEQPHFGTIQNPIQAMMVDHDAEGERFQTIEKLTQGYTPPADACNTYKVAFAMLRDFDDNLKEHIHLENNILFPSAIALEAKFSVSE